MKKFIRDTLVGRKNDTQELATSSQLLLPHQRKGAAVYLYGRRCVGVPLILQIQVLRVNYNAQRGSSTVAQLTVRCK